MIKVNSFYNYLTHYLPAITEFLYFLGHPNVQCTYPVSQHTILDILPSPSFFNEKKDNCCEDLTDSLLLYNGQWAYLVGLNGRILMDMYSY